MNHLYIGHLSFSTVQYSGQAHSKGKVPIFGKILCTEQWCQQKQDNKTKNRTANRFHFRISYEFQRNQSHILHCGDFSGCSDNPSPGQNRSEEHTSELQSHSDLVCRLLLEKKK